LYESYCFSNIPATVMRLCGFAEASNPLPDDCLPAGALGADRIVLFFIDALGWRFVRDFDHPVLQMFRDEGVTSVLTSQFPSTTAAHVTTLSTGLPVGQSGVFEWWMYHEKVSDLISPLLFARRSEVPAPGSLLQHAMRPTDVFPSCSLYHQLHAAGIRTAAVMPDKIVRSVVNRFLLRGVGTSSFHRPGDVPDVVKSVGRQQKSGVISLYMDFLDSAGHKSGPSSAEFASTRDLLLEGLGQCIDTLRDGRTLFLLFADHGQIEVWPQFAEHTIMLDREFPEILRWMVPALTGEPLPPAGGMRDAFLHILPYELETAAAELQNFLGSRAEVHFTADLIAEGLFGPEVSDVFRQRVGNLVILPAPDQSILWSSHGRSRVNYKGEHGGLTPDEMEIPFFALL
jgi:predicted AlkP superfamily pyrophosphatase or phosphodiesterase